MSLSYALLTEEVTEATPATDTASLILQYCIYAAIIVVGLIILCVLRRSRPCVSDNHGFGSRGRSGAGGR